MVDLGSVFLFWMLILFFTPLMFMNGVIFIMNYLTVDKENKMRETLRIMGLSKTAYGLSYTLMQGIFTVFSALVLVAGLLFPLRDDFGSYVNFIAPSFGHMSAFYFAIAVILFGLSTLTFAQMLSTLYSDSKLASQTGPVLMFFPTAISMLLAVNTAFPLGHRMLCRTIIQILYFLPWFPFEVVILDTIYRGGVSLFLGMDVTWAWFALILQPFFYFALYCYFDSVVPNAFGISKSCFYCLKCRRP